MPGPASVFRPLMSNVRPHKMRHVLLLLTLASVIGVVGATSSACVLGLASGTSTWCGFWLVWPIGVIYAIPVAVLFGVPAEFLYRRAGFQRWWQFVLGGVVLSLPLWYQMAQPFVSVRWQQSGFFDSLNYLGSGAIGSFAYWWLRGQRGHSAA
jgi:hypothetical protein